MSRSGRLPATYAGGGDLVTHSGWRAATFETVLDHSSRSDDETTLAEDKQSKDLFAKNLGDNLAEKSGRPELLKIAPCKLLKTMVGAQGLEPRTSCV
jgi:hypothetical protein